MNAAHPFAARGPRARASWSKSSAAFPDTYPISLNALVAGCNQKTSRVPIMNVSEADVLQALDALKAARWSSRRAAGA